jgi:protein ImuB
VSRVPERTLVAWCPDWPVAAAGHPASEPVVVFHANRVVACSAAARAEGVRVGLRRREAQGRCPEVIVIEQDLGRDARTFEPVIAAVEAFTPRVEVVRPGVVAFATRGPSRYFGGDQPLARQVLAAVDAVLGASPGSGCRAGVADGRLAAELAARTCDPSGVQVVPMGESGAFLAPFPASCLDLVDLVDLLVRLGIRTLGDLAALPADAVLARFGPEGAVSHRLARGLDDRPLLARLPPPDLTVTAELDPPVEQMETVAFQAKMLADELHRRLGELGLACTRLAIEAETEHGEHLVRLWRHDGALSATAIAERVRWQLEGWWSTGTPTAGLTLLRLTPDEVKPDQGRQLNLWGGSAAADERAARALARVQGLLGPAGVVTGVVGGGRGPADQICLVPWGDPRQPARCDAGPAGVPDPVRPSRRTRRTMGPSAGECPPWPGRLPPPAPAVVHRRPCPVEVLDDEGRSVTVTARGGLGGPPTKVVRAGTVIDVASWAGPWPVEERWWDPANRCRRARFQLGLADGTAHVVALASGQWCIEATYD